MGIMFAFVKNSLTPGFLRCPAAFAGGLAAVSLIFLLDFFADRPPFFHSLYVVPLAFVALHCQEYWKSFALLLFSISLQCLAFLNKDLALTSLGIEIAVLLLLSLPILAMAASLRGRMRADANIVAAREKAERALRSTLETLQAIHQSLDIEKELNKTIIETSPVGICIYDEKGDCLTANPAMARHIGATLEQVSAQNYHQLDSWKRAGLHDLALKAVATGQPQSALVPVTSSFGKHVHLSVNFSVLRSGGKLHLMLMIMDMTDLMLAERQLQESEERFRRVVAEAPIPIMLHADDGEVLEVNNMWSQITGYRRGDIPTIAEWTRRAYGEEGPDMLEMIRSFYGTSQPIDVGERAIICSDGSKRIWHFTAAPIGKLQDGRRYVISTAQDITERKAVQQQVEFLAYHDPLTGLPNRSLVQDHFTLALSQAERDRSKVAILFLDLDNFKVINDSLGHLVGDGLLREVAARLKKCLRETDTVSRLGGDEFIIVLGGMPDVDAISSVLEKINGQISEPFLIDGNELVASFSVGVSVFPDDGQEYDELLKKADAAMYQSKSAGKNTYHFYSEEMNVSAVETLKIRNAIRRGLENEEFLLYYQPQIDLRTKALVGAEALVRWNHPEFGLIPADRFIPIAEEAGLIVPVGEWVLREACRQAKEWQKAGMPALVVAVNLSALQFKRGNLEKSVSHALLEAGLDPAYLELELTESALIHDAEKVMDTVKNLKGIGLNIAIDDFGTGYSSLSYLKNLAVSKLKIDQSFVRNMVEDPNDAVIVRTIIQMAKNLKLRTIAEGVETEGQVALLDLQDCDEAQGFRFGRPVPAQEFWRAQPLC
jgi:diguanylate cyclase (GGDEF)-like protein/PAS domain S-box-containing protein